MSDIETAAPETTSRPAPSLSADTQAAIQSKFGGRSVSLSSMADSLAQGGGAQAGVSLSAAAPQASAADVAASGFAGGGGEIPHKKEMEASFGTDFSGVKAHTGGPALQANKELGSNAYAAGQNIAFKTSNPSPALVAHELTHTLQPAHNGPAASGAAGGGIDTAGEGEAEAVEAAVASGKPASSALSAGSKATAESRKAGGGAGAQAGGPALKRAPALEGGEGPKWGAGITFSKDAFEVSGQYTIWSHSVEIPIPAVPGLNAMIEPQVVVKGKVGKENAKNKETGKEEQKTKASLGIEGGVGVGLSYGVPNLVSLYGVMEASVAGGFEFTKTGKDWELEGSIGLSSVFAVGVKVGGGILDERFEFGKCDIGKLTGIKFENGKFQKDKLGWEWGEKPKQFFESIKKVIERAKELASMAADAAKKVYNKAKAAGKKVVQGVGDAVSWALSW